MQRRKAIQQIALISTGIVLLPNCHWESFPVYEKVPLQEGQRQVIDRLAQAILPMEELPLELPESTTDFILRMLNDCFAPKDIQRYLDGLQAFQLASNQVEQKQMTDILPKMLAQLNEQHLANIEKASATQVELETIESPLAFFYGTTKQLTQQHFTSSPFFLKEILDFDFVPGRFTGCVSI
ncbi:MAG: gluconate 2-dehydrogenase subunit 3 family protein [Bacteroidota bacterium]